MGDLQEARIRAGTEASVAGKEITISVPATPLLDRLQTAPERGTIKQLIASMYFKNYEIYDEDGDPFDLSDIEATTDGLVALLLDINTSDVDEERAMLHQTFMNRFKEVAYGKKSNS